MKKKSRFVVWLPCKPYVKQFLLHEYNDPDDAWPEIINLSREQELKADFVASLEKAGKWENKYKNLYRYSEQVAVEIKKDDFYRYGWSLSNTEAVRFGVKIERRIKRILFLYLDTSVGMGIPLSSAIRRFQNQYGFTEDSWSYDTIRREYNRHARHERMHVGTTIFDFIHTKIIGELVPALRQFPAKTEI